VVSPGFLRCGMKVRDQMERACFSAYSVTVPNDGVGAGGAVVDNEIAVGLEIKVDAAVEAEEGAGAGTDVVGIVVLDG